MANKRYDAVFIGNSLVAFSAAALLAKKGRSVLLLDPASPSDPAFHFCEGPLFYFGYEHGGAIEGFFSRLAYPIPSLKQKGLLYKRVPPLLQIIQNAHRSNLYSEQDAYFDELNREFGAQTQNLKKLFNQVERDAAPYYPFLGQFQQLEIAGMGERLSEWRKQLDFSQTVRAQQKNNAADYLSQYALNTELREYFNLLSLFAFQKPLSQLSAFDLILLLSSLKKGGVRILSGYQTLRTFFQKLIKSFGGTIKRNHYIVKTTKQGKKISEVTLSDGTTFYGNQYILSQSKPATTLHFHFKIRNDLLPGPMKESLLLTWLGQCPAHLEDILVLRLNLREESEAGSIEMRKMNVSVLLKNHSTGADRKKLEKSILERLNALIPFSESEIQVLPEVKHKKNASPGDPVFSLDSKGETIIGKRREFLKGAAPYYQDKENKNLTILESDQQNTLAWASDFIVGARLAEMIERAK